MIDLPSIWDGKTEERENLWQNSCGEGINNRRPNTTMEATGRAQKRTIEPWVKPVATASDRTDTLGEESSEYGSCVSGWSSLQSASVASTTDWLGSIDSINSPESQSLSVETFPLGGGLSPEISERRLKKLGVVERTLLESWRGLPWQARLCPRAIQVQEDYRRACAFRKEVNGTSPYGENDQKGAKMPLDVLRISRRFYSSACISSLPLRVLYQVIP